MNWIELSNQRLVVLGSIRNDNDAKTSNIVSRSRSSFSCRIGSDTLPFSSWFEYLPVWFIFALVAHLGLQRQLLHIVKHFLSIFETRIFTQELGQIDMAQHRRSYPNPYIFEHNRRHVLVEGISRNRLGHLIDNQVFMFYLRLETANINETSQQRFQTARGLIYQW